MRIPRISLSSTQSKIVVAVAALTIVLTASALAVSYQTPIIYSGATASGKFSIIWGDPYKTANIAQGSGWETFSVGGNVAQWGNVSGYYTYTRFTLNGVLHAEWSSQGNSYVLDANLTLESYETPYMKIVTIPSANSFTVSYVDFAARVTTNGHARLMYGYAGMKAAAPAYLGLQSQDRTTAFILYAPSFGDPQFVIQWSQTDQTVNGMQLPAADHFAQSVTVTNSGYGY